MKVTGLRVVGRFVIRQKQPIPTDVPSNAILDEESYPISDEYNDYIVEPSPENAITDQNGDVLFDPAGDYILDAA